MLFYDMIEKILFLENKIGHKVKYSIIDHQNLKSRISSLNNNLALDANNLMKITKYISEYIGLNDLVVTISVLKRYYFQYWFKNLLVFDFKPLYG
jgi:hypothetical protein